MGLRRDSGRVRGTEPKRRRSRGTRTRPKWRCGPAFSGRGHRSGARGPQAPRRQAAGDGRRRPPAVAPAPEAGPPCWRPARRRAPSWTCAPRLRRRGAPLLPGHLHRVTPPTGNAACVGGGATLLAPGQAVSAELDVRSASAPEGGLPCCRAICFGSHHPLGTSPASEAGPPCWRPARRRAPSWTCAPLLRRRRGSPVAGPATGSTDSEGGSCWAQGSGLPQPPGVGQRSPAGLGGAPFLSGCRQPSRPRCGQGRSGAGGGSALQRLGKNRRAAKIPPSVAGGCRPTGIRRVGRAARARPESMFFLTLSAVDGVQVGRRDPKAARATAPGAGPRSAPREAESGAPAPKGPRAGAGAGQVLTLAGSHDPRRGP